MTMNQLAADCLADDLTYGEMLLRQADEVSDLIETHALERIRHVMAWKRADAQRRHDELMQEEPPT